MNPNIKLVYFKEGDIIFKKIPYPIDVTGLFCIWGGIESI